MDDPRDRDERSPQDNPSVIDQKCRATSDVEPALKSAREARLVEHFRRLTTSEQDQVLSVLDVYNRAWRFMFEATEGVAV